MQAALIAEELDVDLEQVKVDPGMPSPVYYNTALADESAPFRSTDETVMAESTRAVMDVLMKFMGMQVTGGSSSVPDSYVKLRKAGAVARETLKAAAAQKTGISVGQLKTAHGKVQLPDGTELTYEELAPVAAGIAPVTDVVLRDPDEWRLIGKPMLRHDIVAKSTGTQNYGIDFVADNMLYAAVKMNPRQGGPMNGYDAAAVEKMRGVRKVVPLKGGVAVIADNSWRAMQAVDAIAFDWGPAPFPPVMDEHWRTLENSFTKERVELRSRDDGDVDAEPEGCNGYRSRIPGSLSGACATGTLVGDRQGDGRPRRCLDRHPDPAICAEQRRKDHWI